MEPHLTATGCHLPYGITLLKRAGISQAQLLHFYITLIRPILEYASLILLSLRPIRLKLFRKELSTIDIIYISTYRMPYTNTLFLARLTNLTECREQLACKFLLTLWKNRDRAYKLHHLLPPPRDLALLSCLRAPSKFPRIPNGTKKYQPFISYTLSKYHTS